MEVSFSYLGDVVTGVVGADDVLAVLVVTATFHLNIFFFNQENSNCISLIRNITRCFWILETVIWWVGS